MENKTEIIFIRHGESIGNTLTKDERANLDISTHEYPLTPKGIKQSILIGEWLKENGWGNPDYVFCSYYKRAKQTAEYALPNHCAIEDSRLAESNRGIYHFLETSEINLVLPFERERLKQEDFYHYRPLGGENWPDIELRTRSFMDDILNKLKGKKILVFGHGHQLSIFLMIACGYSKTWALATYKQGGKCPNCSITKFVEDNSNSWFPFNVEGKPYFMCESVRNLDKDL